MSQHLLSPPPANPFLQAESRSAFGRGLLLLATLLLAATHYGNADAAPGLPQAAPKLKHRNDFYLQRSCAYFRALGVDYSNDAELLPHALSIHSGTLEPDRIAVFRVLGLSHQDIYQDIAHYLRATSYNSRALRVTVRPAPGSRSVAGKVLLRPSSDNIQRIVYVPAKTMNVDRTAILTFTLQCETPLTTEFTLQLPAGR